MLHWSTVSRKPVTPREHKKCHRADHEMCLQRECERLVSEKAEIIKLLAEFQAQGERRSEEKAEFEESSKLEMRRQIEEFQMERERLDRQYTKTVVSIQARYEQRTAQAHACMTKPCTT